MIFKQRLEPVELRIMKHLKSRMTFTEKDWNTFLKLNKGFEGELQFDKWIKELPKDWFILNDLLLEINDSFIQIDSMIILPNKIYQFEVKNYEGDYFFERGRLYTISGSEIKNPLQQLVRSESLLRRLLQDLGVNLPIESYVCFINPHFHLYQSPKNEPIIFLSQLPRFIKKLNSLTFNKIQSPLSLAEKLISLHNTKSPFNRNVIPDYSFDSLIKGIICSRCQSCVNNHNGALLICEQCGLIENIEAAIFRSVEEYLLLFPQRKFTTTLIYEWCKGIKSKRTIRRILLKRYETRGNSRGCYFVHGEKIGEKALLAEKG